MVKNPSRSPISVQMVMERLLRLEKEGSTSLSVVTLRPLEREGNWVGVILKGEGIILSYLKRLEEEEAEEHVVVTLSEASGTLFLLFRGSMVTKMTIDRLECNERDIPRDQRGDLGTILRISRLFVRDLPLK